MKTASAELKAILNGSSNFLMADLWTITLRNGVVLRYTSADIDLSYGGNTFHANDVLCDGGSISWNCGLEASECNLTLYPNQTESAPTMVGDMTFKEAVIGGLFDRATIKRERAFMQNWGDTTPGTVTLFIGQITSSTSSRNAAEITASDLRYLLNVYMPQRQYQATCAYVFGDGRCQFNREILKKNSSVMVGSTGSTIKCALTDAPGYFNNGIVQFTSGVNQGLVRSVKYWANGEIQLVAPFPKQVSVDDQFSITPGCSKNFAGETRAFTAAANAGSTPNTIYSSLSNAAGYFNGGTLQFTSGSNKGQTRTISTWANGTAVISGSFPYTPTAGDSFVITSSASNAVGSCTGYANTSKFGGMRFIPVAETSY